MCVNKIRSDGSIIICNDSYDGTATISVNPDVIANNSVIRDKINIATTEYKYEIRNSFEDLSYKIKQIEEEYENQLQRQKVHISRGDGIKGNRIYCRRRKITIPKRSS